VAVAVGERLGGDVDLGDNRILRCYLAKIIAGEPAPTEHDAVRWIGPDDIDGVEWLDSDRALLPDLLRALQLDRRHR
jgi:8-oxo-dGTP diphosphatase